MVGSNVRINLIDASSAWHDWAVDPLQACSERAPLRICQVVWTELLVREPEVAALDATLDVSEIQLSAMPRHCAELAAEVFSLYR